MQLFWILALAYCVVFAFFLALGAFDPADVLPWTIATAGLALLWVLHAIWVSRHRGGERDPSEIRARERRGF